MIGYILLLFMTMCTQKSGNVKKSREKEEFENFPSYLIKYSLIATSKYAGVHVQFEAVTLSN